MPIKRKQLVKLEQQMNGKRRFIQVLMGPRQVGKTTMVNQLLKQMKLPFHFVSADAASHMAGVWIKQQWETARLKFKQSESKEFILVIDEVQKIDNWSEEVKALWDEDTRARRNMKVILLGSSRLLLQTGLTESLAGRFESIYVPHWSFTEMKKAFGFTENQFVWFGAYPGAADLIKDEERWKNYVLHSLIETSISKDILMLTRVDKPALMKRLFELGCDYSGQILSFTKILGQLHDAGNTTTLSNYLQLLNTAGLLSGLEKFSNEKIRVRSSSPKFQVHNTALISAQKQETFKQAAAQNTLWGRLVESAVGSHLLNQSIVSNFELHYWREGNNEIDFVLKKGNKIVGIEVKTGVAKETLGTVAFKKKFPSAKIILIEKSGMSWQEFLSVNPEELF